MFNIADYLKKFAHLEGDLVFQKEIINKALKEVCNLENIEFEIRKGTLHLKTNPVVKSIIFIKKDKLVEYLRANLSDGKILDVR